MHACMHDKDGLHALRAALFHHFKQPIMITEGRMQYLYDERGRRYLDVRILAFRLHHACMRSFSSVSMPCPLHAMLISCSIVPATVMMGRWEQAETFEAFLNN